MAAIKTLSKWVEKGCKNDHFWTLFGPFFDSLLKNLEETPMAAAGPSKEGVKKVSFEGSGPNPHPGTLKLARPRKRGPAPVARKCPPLDAPYSDSGSLNVSQPFFGHFPEHGTMGLENLAGPDTS